MTPARRKLLAQVRALGVDQRTAMRTLVDQIAEQRGLPRPWGTAPSTLPALVDVEEVGEVYQALLADDKTRTTEHYTPYPVAEYMARHSLDLYPGRDPLDFAVIDPACGAGVFLVAACRCLADRQAVILAEAGFARSLEQIKAVVAYECIYGVDTDPVAVDLARSALWLDVGGIVPFGWLDRNIIVGNVLEGDLPPRYEEKCPTGTGPGVVEVEARGAVLRDAAGA